ncbi:three-helix bundle dimerization domain-containing protein [Mycolicibacterium brisbanense]
MSEIAEQTALAQIRQRLVQEFPGTSLADVEAAVTRAHARFADRPIRDFVPLFVEKHARHSLAQHREATSA